MSCAPRRFGRSSAAPSRARFRPNLVRREANLLRRLSLIAPVAPSPRIGFSNRATAAASTTSLFRRCIDITLSVKPPSRAKGPPSTVEVRGMPQRSTLLAHRLRLARFSPPQRREWAFLVGQTFSGYRQTGTSAPVELVWPEVKGGSAGFPD
jgi:hypothetical protein